MKKKVLFVAALFTASFGMAQDLTSKKGEAILPEAGDYAIGFDANPFINYFGNMLNTGANAPFSANFTNTNQAIYGKMFTDANNAYRFGLRVGAVSITNATKVAKMDAGVVDADGEMVDNEIKSSNINFVLSAGKEMRRGNTRLQGFYGAEAMLALGTSKTENTYGNNADDQYGALVGTRTLSSKAGTTFGIGARGFLGVEYFVAAKISIAAEYGWGLMISTTAEGETVTENYDGTKDSKVTTNTGKSSAFGLDTDVSGGSLKVMFHF
jgi:hypothetical protein